MSWFRFSGRWSLWALLWFSYFFWNIAAKVGNKSKLRRLPDYKSQLCDCCVYIFCAVDPYDFFLVIKLKAWSEWLVVAKFNFCNHRAIFLWETEFMETITCLQCCSFNSFDGGKVWDSKRLQALVILIFCRKHWEWFAILKDNLESAKSITITRTYL